MHEIQAVIGSEAVLKKVQKALNGAAPRDLGAGLWILAVDENKVAALPGLKGFGYPDLSEVKTAEALEVALKPLTTFLAQLKLPDVLAFVVTQYWGGTGTQAAVVLRSGAVTHHLGDGAINHALEDLGVAPTSSGDSWTTVQLSRFRSNDAFAKDGAVT